MSEERICKSCGIKIHFSIYKQNDGRCNRCLTGYKGRNFEEESKLASDRYFDAPSDDKEIWQKGYITGAKTEYELLKPQLEYANNTINKFSEALVTRDSNLKRISIEFVEFLRDEAWELEYRDQRDYTLEELYEFFEKNICKVPRKSNH